MGRVTLSEVRHGGEVLQKVRDGLAGPSESLGWVGGPSRRSGTGWGTFRDVRDVSGDTPGGLGWVGGPFQRSGTGQGTF